jgi:GTPase SAR1 family protein
VILLGDGGTGKSSLIGSFCADNFARSYQPTLGADFVLKRVPLPGVVGGMYTFCCFLLCTDITIGY